MLTLEILNQQVRRFMTMVSGYDNYCLFVDEEAAVWLTEMFPTFDLSRWRSELAVPGSISQPLASRVGKALATLGLS